MWTSREVKVYSLVGIASLILALTTPSQARALGDDEAHAGLSFGMTSVSYLAMRSYGFKKTESLFTSAALATIFGMAKELGDDRPSTTDINADLSGVGAAVVVLFVFDWFD